MTTVIFIKKGMSFVSLPGVCLVQAEYKSTVRAKKIRGVKDK
jgi:hypothetical protein